MELSVINDTVVATTQALGFQTGKLLFLRRQSYNPNNVAVVCEIGSPETIAGGILAISAGILPMDTMAPPPVKSDSYRVAPRVLARRTKRAPRRFSLTGEGEKGSDDGSAGNNNDGPFGGGGGGGGNNFNGDERSPWDDGSSSSSADPAFDFVYEVVCWIALSNCLHFAFKKVVRNLGNVMEDPSREKVPSFARCSL